MVSRQDMPFAELFETPLRNGLTKPKAVRGEGMKMVNMGEVFAHRRIHNLDMDRVPMETKERDSSLLRAGDLLFARQSLVLSGAGKCVLFQGDKEDVTFESHIIRCRLDQQKAAPAFYFYLFQSSQGRSLIESIVEQVAAAGIRGSDLGRLVVPVPPLAEQKAIAAVLGALDDKIELNRRMNATLEAMARALFQSWFVDFDPVRAKLDGRVVSSPLPVGEGQGECFCLDPATAALFPATFQDSPLGRIPTGWGTSTIGAKLQTVLGGTPSRAKPEYWTDGTVAWINSGKTNEFRIIEPSEWITKEALENSATKLLPHRTTVLAITGATLGQVSITEIECCANQSVVAIPASEQFPTEFIYPWIEENIEKLIASQTGGAQQHINKGNVEELALLCPDRRIVAAYQTKAKPLFDKIAANCFQSRTLATLRDTLLPKLLSGELSVAGGNSPEFPDSSNQRNPKP